MDELIVDRRKPIPHTKEGRALVVRPLPFQVAMDMGGGETVTAAVMADMIASSVLYEGTEEAAFTKDEILWADSDMVLKLFQAVQDATTSFEEAEKNS